MSARSNTGDLSNQSSEAPTSVVGARSDHCLSIFIVEHVSPEFIVHDVVDHWMLNHACCLPAEDLLADMDYTAVDHSAFN
eukprot:1709035-Amphidinium_carterae.1